jgi:intracellular septation protein
MTEDARLKAPPARRKIDPRFKFAVELGPLAGFFIAYAKFGIYVATGVLMVCVLASLAISYALLRRVPIMPLVTAVIVVIFGSLTLFFHNETLIKIKPTALYLMFAAALFGSMAMNKLLLPVLFDAAFTITNEGWRKLTYRWAFFFLALAILNEIIWRTQSTDFWVGFKTFGVLPLTVLFGLAQAPLIMRYESKEAESDAM